MVKNRINFLSLLLAAITLSNNIIPMELAFNRKEYDIVSDYKENISPVLGILDIPEEMLLQIIGFVIEPHINKLNDIFNLDKFDNLELITDIENFCLSCKTFNIYKKDIIKIVKKAKEKRLQYLKGQIKEKYLNFSKKELNAQLLVLLDKFSADINHIVTEGYLVEIVKLIISGANVNTKNYLGVTALMIASSYTSQRRDYLILTMENGHKGITELILSLGADINAQDDNGTTPLMYAVMFGNRNIVRSLLNANAITNIKNRFGMSACMYSYQSSGYSIGITELLMFKDPIINIKELVIRDSKLREYIINGIGLFLVAGCVYIHNN